MRAILLLIVFFVLSSSANKEAQELRVQILGALAHTVTTKDIPFVYLDDQNFKNFNTKKYGFMLVQQCDRADVIFTDDVTALVKKCPQIKNKKLFALSYKDYAAHENQAIGAFFWQKGRPNIILNKKLLQHYDIKLSQRYEKYVE